MAVPTLTTDYTNLTAFEATTGLSSWGSNSLSKWDLSTDFVRENTYSLALAPKSTGDSGMGVTTGANINLSTNRLFMWVNIVSPSFVSTAASKGVYVRICTSSTSWTTDYKDFIVGGSDVAWVGGGWHLIALDCNRTADASSGTTTLSTIRRVGIGFNIQAAAAKSDVICCDQWWYGTYVEATGVTSSSANHSFSGTTITGSSNFTTDGFESGDVVRVNGTVSNDGEYTANVVGTTTMTVLESLTTESSVASDVDGGITLESIYEEDGPTQDYWYGIVTKDRNGNYEINGDLRIGDQSGALRTFFVSRGDPVILADQPLSASTAGLGIKSYEDTGNTIVVFGQSTGTEDDRVGFDGSTVRQDTEFVGQSTDGAALGEIDLGNAIDTCEVFGTTFQDVNNGVLFANDTSHYVTNCVFNNCGQIDLYAVEARGLEFSNFVGGASTGALLWRTSVTDIKSSRFLACTRGIEHVDDVAEVNYYALVFAGNTYDIDYSDGSSGDLIVNNQPGSDASTYTISGSGTTVTINTSYTLTITVQDRDTDPIQNVQTAIYKISDRTELMNEDTTALGVATEVYSGSVPIDVEVRCRKASSADSPKYENYSTLGTISGDFSLLVTMKVDDKNNSIT